MGLKINLKRFVSMERLARSGIRCVRPRTTFISEQLNFPLSMVTQDHRRRVLLLNERRQEVRGQCFSTAMMLENKTMVYVAFIASLDILWPPISLHRIRR